MYALNKETGEIIRSFLYYILYEWGQRFSTCKKIRFAIRMAAILAKRLLQYIKNIWK